MQEPVDEGKIEKLKLNTKTGRPLGSDKFIAKLEKKLGIKITIESPGRKKIKPRFIVKLKFSNQ